MDLRYAEPRFNFDEEQMLQDKEDKRDKRNQKRWKLFRRDQDQIRVSSYDDFMNVVRTSPYHLNHIDVVAKQGPKGDIGWSSHNLWSLSRNLQERFRITSEDVFVEYFNSNGMLKVPLSPRVDLNIALKKHLVLSGPAGDFLVSGVDMLNSDNSWNSFNVVGDLSFVSSLEEFHDDDLGVSF